MDLTRNNLRKFGLTMGIAFLLLTSLIFFRHKHSIIPTLSISALFFVFAFSLPQLLKPVYLLWMKLAFVLAWVNTRLILLLVFYLIFTPIGLVLKLFGKDLLETKMDKKRTSWWHKKPETIIKAQEYERQF